MSAPNGNVTAWISVIGATIVTVVVLISEPVLGPSTVTAFFAFIGGLMMGRYLVPSQRPTSPPVQSGTHTSSPPGSLPTAIHLNGSITKH